MFSENKANGVTSSELKRSIYMCSTWWVRNFQKEKKNQGLPLGFQDKVNVKGRVTERVPDMCMHRNPEVQSLQRSPDGTAGA